MYLFRFGIIASLYFLEVFSLNNGLARTPPMGWLSWERFRCIVDCDVYPDQCISERLFRDMADHIASDGYKEAGYEYIIIDDCWAAKERDENGRLQPDPDRFPSGIKNLSDYIHNKGLKFGIYGDIGNKTCGGYPGTYNYMKQDADTFAEWEVDYFKLDACYIPFEPTDENFREEYGEMGKYLNETGRPIVYSCSWPAYLNATEVNYTAIADTCNLWRNWDDIDDSWVSVEKIINWFAEYQDEFADAAGPGHWNDPDMLIIGDFGLSYEQSRAQMAVWAILAAPLIMSVDLRTIKTPYRDILLNEDAIAINQDPLGIQGEFIKKIDKISIWKRKIASNESCESFAIAFVSHGDDGYIRHLSVKLNEIGLTCRLGYLMTDVFHELRDEIILPEGSLNVDVPSSGVVFLKAVPHSPVIGRNSE